MLLATKAYLCCAFMQWAGMEEMSGTPVNINLPPKTSSQEEREKFLTDTIGKFVEEFVSVECDIEKAWQEQHEQKRQQQRCPCSQTFTASTPSTCTSSTANPQIQTDTIPVHRVSSFKRQSFQVSNFVGLILLLLKLTIKIMIVAIETVVLERVACIKKKKTFAQYSH